MGSRGRRVLGAALAAAALSLAAAGPVGATTIGSNLLDPPNGGVCPTSGSGEVTCSFVQASLANDHQASSGVQPEGDYGVITSWKISTGAATAATTGAKARLRIVEGGGVPYAYGASEYEALPLGEPGVHVFPARLSIDEPKQAIAIDTAVTGNGSGEAAAPFAFRAGGVGSVWKWVPGLEEGGLPLSDTEGDLELLFNVEVEPDRDHDGYGDKTQDKCPKDRSRQDHCDVVPPRTKMTYAPRQDFLRTGKVVVYVRANEPAKTVAGGQIDIKGLITYGIYSDRKYVAKGEKAKLVLRVPAKARRAAARAFARGRQVTASISAYARDTAGNFSGDTVASIKPKR
ncbi:MAG: hypothetical protein ACTHNY_10850 [Solirubrobacterales bacterium]